jgi:hypothetical protein
VTYFTPIHNEKTRCFCAAQNGRSWPKADTAAADHRGSYWGQSGHRATIANRSLVTLPV